MELRWMHYHNERLTDMVLQYRNHPILDDWHDVPVYSVYVAPDDVEDANPDGDPHL